MSKKLSWCKIEILERFLPRPPSLFPPHCLVWMVVLRRLLLHCWNASEALFGFCSPRKVSLELIFSEIQLPETQAKLLRKSSWSLPSFSFSLQPCPHPDVPPHCSSVPWHSRTLNLLINVPQLYPLIPWYILCFKLFPLHPPLPEIKTQSFIFSFGGRWDSEFLEKYFMLGCRWLAMLW